MIHMDFFFDDQPCSSESSPKNGHEVSQMTEDSHDSSTGKSSSVSITENQEQHTSSRIDNIRRRVQDSVEKINNSRSRDQELMDSFQEKLSDMVTEMFQQMKEHMYTVYEENSNAIQVKLQELSEVLERCTKLDKELTEADQALASLRQVINQTSK